jgi:predicted ATPase
MSIASTVTASILPLDLKAWLIGRTKEISDIKKLLASARLLTLTGVGGAGKTRLAIKVAEEMLEHFADGAWLVELAGLSDSALVPQTVASTLGISEQQGRPLMETLIQDLGPKSMLLVIDNCEHLITACAELVSKALRASSRVRIVATSREKLGVSGEVNYRVPSLSIPEIDSVISPDVLMNYEAPRLFIERAACVQVGFAATPPRVNQIVQICARLDGLPLAIELAAARVNVLSVDQICSRLNDRFRLLGQGSRAPLERHQTLQAVIDWSYQLLSDDERTLLRRLSVFAGNWTLEAAEAICVGDGLQESEVLDLMARLIDKSLVVAQTQGSEARYLLLETVRQYGQTKLIEGGEDKVKRDVHLRFFSALAEQAEPHLQGLEMVKWAERVEADNDNIRAALRWSLNGGDPAVGLRLAGAMAFFWRTRGYVNEGSRWFEDLLLRTPDGPYFARAKAYFGTGWLAWWKGANLEATELTEKALYTFRSLGDKWWIARSLQEIAFHSFARGEYERSASLAEEALALAHDLGDKYVAGYSLVLKAIVAEHLGDDVKATAMYRECLAARRQVGPIFGISTALRGLGRVALRHGHYDEARRAYTEGLSLALKEGDRSSAAPSLEGIVALAIRQHAYERAAKLLGAAEGQRQAIGIPPLAWELHSYESSLKALAALFGEERLTLLRAEGRDMTLDQAIAYGQEDF